MFMLDTVWNPARELQRLRDEIDHVFSGASGAVHEFPPVNVWTHAGGATLSAELPGFDPAAVEISVHNELLTLRGQRPAPELKEGDWLLRSERASGTFTRTLRLPFRVDADKVEARFNRGVLTVHLPRAVEDTPRKITVKAE